MNFQDSINVWVTLLIILLRDTEALKSLTIRVPEIVKSGDTATLACNYDLEEVALYTIKWYRGDEEFYRYVPKESPPTKAFTVPYINVDVTNSGPTEVTLKAVRRELSGDYKCEVSADAPLFHTEIKIAHMTVVEVPTTSPVLTIKPKKIEVGKKIDASCISSASDPPANITWYINDELVQKTHEDVRIHPTKYELDSESDKKSSHSRIEIIANRSLFSMGPMILKCEASVYSIWSTFTDGFIRDETPLLAPVLLSTSSQTHEEDNFDFFGRNCSSGEKATLLLYLIIVVNLLIYR